MYPSHCPGTLRVPHHLLGRAPQSTAGGACGDRANVHRHRVQEQTISQMAYGTHRLFLTGHSPLCGESPSSLDAPSGRLHSTAGRRGRKVPVQQLRTWMRYPALRCSTSNISTTVSKLSQRKETPYLGKYKVSR